MNVQEIQNIQYACDLMKLGLRLPLVSSLSGIKSRLQLRSLWKEINDKSPVPGRLPDSVIRYIKDYQFAAELAGFVSLYHSIQNNQDKVKSSNKKFVLDPLILLETCQAYKRLIGKPIDINAGYYAIRDVIFGIVLYPSCKSCSASFIYDPSKSYTEKCPFCKTLYIVNH